MSQRACAAVAGSGLSHMIHLSRVKPADSYKGPFCCLATHLDLDSWANFDLESAEDSRHLLLAPADHLVRCRGVSTTP